MVVVVVVVVVVVRGLVAACVGYWSAQESVRYL